MPLDLSNYRFNLDNSFRRLPRHFYSYCPTQSAPSPTLVCFNEQLVSELGLDFSCANQGELSALFSADPGTHMIHTMAQAYAGHQFGHLSLLGDGRAHLLGEHVTDQGLRYDIQFKGSGKTPYSRGGDGQAALGPMLREMLVSEAMHHLGIPTSRSLAVATTGQTVFRDRVLPGAVLTRVASSHIRIGTFEYAALTQAPGDLKALLDYTLKRHYPDCLSASNPALAFLDVVMKKQIALMVAWMRVGFIHGVMNTDNCMVSGETLDYGPCAFLDAYHPNTVFSAIDSQGRYAFSQQSHCAKWNCVRLAETLLPLIDSSIDKACHRVEAVIRDFDHQYQSQWLDMMLAKIGCDGRQDDDQSLVDDLLSWMADHQADYTQTFYHLTLGRGQQNLNLLKPSLRSWYQRWQKRLILNQYNQAQSNQMMQTYNPCLIPRNHILDQALHAANEGDTKPWHDFYQAIQSPYDYKSPQPHYQQPPLPHERIHTTFCGT